MIALTVKRSKIIQLFICTIGLQTLIIQFNITEDSLLALSTHCPLLKELDLTCIPRITTCAPSLSCIHSIQTSYIHLMHNPDTSYFAIIVPYLTGLWDLCADSSNDHLLLPLISEYCLQLESFTIDNNSSATPTQILQLAQNCTQLKCINFYTNSYCTDEFIIGLAQRCSNLQLILFDNHGAYCTVTDASLLALSKHCPKLREIYMYYLTLLTETAVLQLIQKCKHLNNLVLPNTIISEDTVLTLPVTATRNSNTLFLTFNA